jgi:hypothetical protein
MFDMDQPPFICQRQANCHRVGVGGVGEWVQRRGTPRFSRIAHLARRPFLSHSEAAPPQNAPGGILNRDLTY